MHLRVRRFAAGGAAAYDKTTQLFFPEDVSAAVQATAAYKGSGSPATTNSNDRIYRKANEVTLSGSVASGSFVATYTIHLPMIV